MIRAKIIMKINYQQATASICKHQIFYAIIKIKRKLWEVVKLTYSISVVLLQQGDRNSLLESLSIVERQTLKDIEVIIVNQSTEEIVSISQQMDLSLILRL